MTSEILAYPSVEPALTELLSGRQGLGPVRELLAAPVAATRSAAHATWPDLRRHELVRSKFKPGRSLTGWYAVRGLDSGDAPAQHTCVTWKAEGVEVLEAPEDPTMPQLHELHDVGRRRDLIGAVTTEPVPDAALSPLRTVRYRPRQRHVLVLGSETAASRLVVKLDRDDAGRRAVPLARALAQVLDTHVVRVVEPLGYAPSVQAAIWVHASGSPLSSLVGRRPDQAAGPLRSLGRAIRAVHDTGPELLAFTDSPSVDEDPVFSELATALRAGELLRVLLPATWSTYESVLTAVGDGLTRMASAPRTLVHGDLKSDNVLVDEGALRILDLDRARWSDPAVDLGRMIADLRWWSARTGQRDTLVTAFRTGYAVDDPQLWRRAELWATVFELRQAARRCAIHDGRWAEAIRARVRRAVDARSGAPR